MGEVVRYSQAAEEQFRATAAQALRSQVELMDQRAAEVSNAGGECDQSTFLTVLFKDALPSMGWVDNATNDGLLASLPAEATQAVQLADKLDCADGEPFMERRSENRWGGVHDFGMVALRGVASPLSYHIFRHKPDLDAEQIECTMKVNSFWSVGRDLVPELRNTTVFLVKRYVGSEEVTMHLGDIAVGVAEVRQHLNSRRPHLPSHKQLFTVDHQLNVLRRAAAKQAREEVAAAV